jgi:DNA-binding NarL/FixJ family response regulator
MHMKLLIADDHDAIRENIESFLSKRSDIDVVGEAANGEDAAELAMKLPADIVLMDMDMPRLNGLEATRHILESNPETRIVILSANARKDSVVAGLRAGILGYILKSCISDDLIPALFAAMENRLFLSAQIADALAQNPIR